MLKKIILFIALVLPMSAFAQKFGVVNTDEVFQSLPEFTQIKTQAEDAAKKYEGEFQKLREELEKLYADFQSIAEDPNTPQAIKERRMQEIQEREAKVNQFRQTAQEDLARLQQQLVEPVQKKIMEAIQTVGQEGGYTFIFPAEQGLLLYQSSAVVDLTSTVKAKLGVK
ncbi:MAG: OmpH family outer membrane protein [Muribaculaceae bacterium]|nr:OmpH family outer membrane protein [Muribaculaceae bacterium]